MQRPAGRQYDESALSVILQKCFTKNQVYYHRHITHLKPYNNFILQFSKNNTTMAIHKKEEFNQKE